MQYEAWSGSWVNYNELQEKMAVFSDSNSKVSVLVSLTEGKNHADLVLMGDTFG